MWCRADCSGAAQAGVICYLLFLLTQAVDGYFATKPLPEQYTAHNIAVLLQTVVRGLAYLLTFIFGANAVGLTGERCAALRYALASLWPT